MSTTVAYSPTSGTYKQVNLATDFDLTLRVIEYDDAFVSPNKPIQSTVDFEVKRDLVSKQAFSKFMANMLKPSSNFVEGDQDIVELKDQSCRAIDPFLRELHFNKDHHVKDVDLDMVWLVLHTADFFGFSLEPLRDWFDKCFQSNVFWATSLNYARQTLYPTYIFNQAAAFTEATETLVYEGEGHLTESTPFFKASLHLPNLVIQQLNAAKGRVRNILHDGLFDACRSLLDQSCPCKERVFFGYFKKMCDLEVLPFETTFKGTSISDMIWRAGHFDWTPPPDSCDSCRRDYHRLIKLATTKAERYFDGMCLDCMDASKSKTKNGDRHSDYWMHNRLQSWDKGCRVRHGEPSWYFSFMGRKDDQVKMLREFRRVSN
ncbi:hypothetical protein EV356DRAFT_193808 [Viridothelium virens]|uniref:Uncharacterized protein n=1 Tax=Viridothelium virens TaxID=1048519 RepID=A0A6A6H6R8_VIRVR|nr:hypothetical protein EV356DRAFT_193808 [Viridothelium virens]